MLMVLMLVCIGLCMDLCCMMLGVCSLSLWMFLVVIELRLLIGLLSGLMM